MKRTRITDKITYVDPQLPRNESGCAGLIISSNPKICIDCNVGQVNEQAFVIDEKPDIALVSHYHVDHWAWVNAAATHNGTGILVPHGEKSCFTSLDNYVDQCLGKKETTVRPAWKQIAENLGGYRPLERFDTYPPDQTYRFGATTIQCIHTPGHSPYHTCFYFPDEKVLYTADMGIGPIPPWYGHRNCDLKAFVDSILQLRSLETHIVLTAHSGIIRKDILRAWDRCLKHFLMLEKRIRRQLDHGKTKEQIAKNYVLSARISDTMKKFMPFIDMWAKITVDHHAAVIEQGGLAHLFPELRDIRM
jgi:hydroxyacylglutathione hydrolase